MENRSETTHLFDDLSVAFSSERLSRYYQDNSNNKQDALIAYSWNIDLSQSFYPAIQTVEVTMRNALNRTLSDYFETPYWYDDVFLYDTEKLAIRKAKEKLVREKKSVEPGRIVAELSFGFWTSLFDVRYEHEQILWPKLLKPAFPFLPRGQRTRSFLSRKLNHVRRLRNRVFHYEPIWYWSDLENQHSDIVNIVSWISPPASEYIKCHDNFPDIYKTGKLVSEIKLKNWKINL